MRYAFASESFFVGDVERSEAQIEVKGYGKSSPKVPNTSDENRARNRRVEIKVVP